MRYIFIFDSSPFKWEFLQFVISLLAVWTSIIFKFKEAEDSFQGASARSYLWLHSSAGNDSLPSYIKAISEDVPRSWTLPLVEEADQQPFEDNLTASIIHASRTLGFLKRSGEQYGATQAQVTQAKAAISEMKADLDRSAKDQEAAIIAKQRAEKKQKELAKARDELDGTVRQ